MAQICLDHMSEPLHQRSEKLHINRLMDVTWLSGWSCGPVRQRLWVPAPEGAIQELNSGWLVKYVPQVTFDKKVSNKWIMFVWLCTYIICKPAVFLLTFMYPLYSQSIQTAAISAWRRWGTLRNTATALHSGTMCMASRWTCMKKAVIPEVVVEVLKPETVISEPAVIKVREENVLESF